MSTRIRLRRMGSNKRPFFRVVVADQRSPRDGRFIENIGRYHPLADPSVIDIDQERALHWLRIGAQPSNQVRILMQKVGIWEEFAKERPSAAAATTKDRTPKERVSKKAKQKAESESSDVATTDVAAPVVAETPAAIEPTAPESGTSEATPREPEVAEASAAEAVEAAPEAPAVEAVEAEPEAPAADAPPDEDDASE
jgi:small subunit ribosomal protein S16